MENFNLESQMYKLHELQVELERGKEQYEKAIPQYTALIDIIKKSGHEEQTKDVDDTISHDGMEYGGIRLHSRISKRERRNTGSLCMKRFPMHWSLR